MKVFKNILLKVAFVCCVAFLGFSCSTNDESSLAGSNLAAKSKNYVDGKDIVVLYTNDVH